MDSTQPRQDNLIDAKTKKKTNADKKKPEPK